MKLFTLKDFIKYHNPCFSCQQPIYIKFGLFENYTNTVFSELKPVMGKDYLELELKVTYSNIFKIQIFYKTNKLVCSNLKQLSKYLDQYSLALETYCKKCRSSVRSNNLKVLPNQKFIAPIELVDERFFIFDKNKRYYLYSDYSNNTTQLTIDDFNNGRLNKPLVMDLPLYSLDKFKSKDELLNKIKLWITFS